jgi:hypothetical protein
MIVGEWSATYSFVGPRTSFAAAIHGNRVYVLGGLHADGERYTLYNDVQFATLGNDGSIAENGWQSTASFSIPRSGVAALAPISPMSRICDDVHARFC